MCTLSNTSKINIYQNCTIFQHINLEKVVDCLKVRLFDEAFEIINIKIYYIFVVSET